MAIRVRGSSGKLITIEVLGIAEVARRLRKAGKDIKEGLDLGVVEAGTFVEEEVKDSIAGNRDEPRSVLSGRFGNSIEFRKIEDGVGVVEAKSERYPNSNMTTDKLAVILEHGTSRITGRKHFENTKNRTSKKVRDIIDRRVKRKI